MTGVPESPVREYAKQIAGLMQRKRDAEVGVPVMWTVEVIPAWQHGYRAGLSDARAIVAEQAPLARQETTRFEYQVVGVDNDRAPEYSRERSSWLDSFDKARSVRLGWEKADPPFDDLYIKRRTVTVTEPVRLDSDGEPIS
jgi:hypothetical protein